MHTDYSIYFFTIVNLNNPINSYWMLCYQCTQGGRTGGHIMPEGYIGPPLQGKIL